MILRVKQFTHLPRFGPHNPLEGDFRLPRGEQMATKPAFERVLLFCLLGLVLTATILLVTAPGAVTWALALIE